MAKFLFVPIPVTGHLTPSLVLARAVVARGHHVTVYTGARYRAKVEGAGCEHRPFRKAADLEFERLNEILPERPQKAGLSQARWDLKKLVIDMAADQLDDLLDLTDEHDYDAVVADPMAPSAGFLCEERGLPLALVNAMNLFAPSRDVGPDGFGLHPTSSPLGRLRNRLLNWLVWDVILGDVTRHLHATRERLGLRPLTGTLFDLPFHLCQLFLQPTVPSFEYPRSDLPSQVHFIGALLPPAPEGWERPAWWSRLEEDRPVVVVTQGTVATNFDDLIVPTIRALAEEDVLVIATTGDRPVESIAERADNLIVEPFVPFGALFPHADVYVTNGGYGGIHYALVHGVPLVVAGQTEDKAETCARVGWSGAGIDLRTTRPQPAALRRAVRSVLDSPGYRGRVRAIQAELSRLDGPTRGAELLEELAAGAR